MDKKYSLTKKYPHYFKLKITLTEIDVDRYPAYSNPELQLKQHKKEKRFKTREELRDFTNKLINQLI